MSHLTPLLSATRLIPRQLLVIVLIVFILLTGLSLGSYALPMGPTGSNFVIDGGIIMMNSPVLVGFVVNL